MIDASFQFVVGPCTFFSLRIHSDLVFSCLLKFVFYWIIGDKLIGFFFLSCYGLYCSVLTISADMDTACEVLLDIIPKLDDVSIIVMVWSFWIAVKILNY